MLVVTAVLRDHFRIKSASRVKSNAVAIIAPMTTPGSLLKSGVRWIRVRDEVFESCPLEYWVGCGYHRLVQLGMGNVGEYFTGEAD